ncbi:hypothetical protein, partial [Aurantimicrobium sp.]|uniref:hypothetical protein n=1 Tax=Aurantimicrobium sp. TaxID=1930784 RepID=UPI002FC88F13
MHDLALAKSLQKSNFLIGEVHHAHLSLGGFERCKASASDAEGQFKIDTDVFMEQLVRPMCIRSLLQGLDERP